jgi:3-phenylpropionate/trans-cinnamate dioxygenase ferredoxin subunit
MSWVEFAEINELEEGSAKKIKVKGHEILLARVGSRYYAADSRCPHFGGDLSEGTLKGTIITCPKHGSKFDLADGRVVRWTDWSGLKLSLAKTLRSPRPLKTYAVKVEDEKIMVDL